jgi:hypothetical protein
VALGGCTVTSQKGVYYLFPATAAIGPSEYLLLRSNVCEWVRTGTCCTSTVSDRSEVTVQRLRLVITHPTLSLPTLQLYTGGNTTPYQFKGRLGAHGDTITVACGEQTLDQVHM